MIQMQSTLEVADNSGAKTIVTITNLRQMLTESSIN